MISTGSSPRSIVGFLALLGCLLLSFLETSTVHATSANELYERDLSRLSKLKMERRLDANKRLRPRASILPPPPVTSVSIPDFLAFATCPTITGLGGVTYDATYAVFINAGAQIYCQYPFFDGIQPQCVYDPTNGVALSNYDNLQPGGTAICGTLNPPTGVTGYWGTCQATGATIIGLTTTTQGTAYCTIQELQNGFPLTCTFVNGVLDESVSATPDPSKCRAYDVQMSVKFGPILLSP